MVAQLLSTIEDPRSKRVVLKTEVFNSPEALDCEDSILPNHSRHENQI